MAEEQMMARRDLTHSAASCWATDPKSEKDTPEQVQEDEQVFSENLRTCSASQGVDGYGI